MQNDYDILKKRPVDFPTGADCWEIAKGVWPELTDDMPIIKKAAWTSKVAERAWNASDLRLKKGEKERLDAAILTWRREHSLVIGG